MPCCFLVGFLLVLDLLTVVQGQLGTTVCACNPSEYTFMVRYDLACPGNIQNDDGIAYSDCFSANHDSEQDLDFVPVAVTEIKIDEINMDGFLLNFSIYDQNLVDGSTFVYTPVVATQPPSEVRVTRFFQVSITGKNTEGRTIGNFWIIEFTNECGVFPIFSVGDHIGWLEIAAVGHPSNSFCPGGNPTQSPPTLPETTPATSSEHSRKKKKKSKSSSKSTKQRMEKVKPRS